MKRDKTIQVTNEEGAALLSLVTLLSLQELQSQQDGLWSNATFWKHIQSLNKKLSDVMDDNYDFGNVMKGEWVIKRNSHD